MPSIAGSASHSSTFHVSLKCYVPINYIANLQGLKICFPSQMVLNSDSRNSLKRVTLFGGSNIYAKCKCTMILGKDFTTYIALFLGTSITGKIEPASITVGANKTLLQMN